MPTTTTSHTFQVVTSTTTLPMSTVLARLDTEIAKPASGAPALAPGATTKDDLEARIHSAVGPSGFLYFGEFNFGALLQFYEARTPRAMVYVIGNPLTARGILQHNIRGANNVPFRVLITEGADGAGTEIVYNLPSSLIVLEDNEPLRAAAEGLDRNLEAMVERITAV